MITDKTIVLHGPQGCGKSSIAENLMQAFGCLDLVNGWDGKAPVEPGTLAVTNVQPPFDFQPDIVISAEECA